MFDYFKGYVTDKRKNSKGTYLSIEVSGVGYLLEISDRDFSSISISEDKPQKIYSVLTHREDAMSLYGFLNKVYHHKQNNDENISYSKQFSNKTNSR